MLPPPLALRAGGFFAIHHRPAIAAAVIAHLRNAPLMTGICIANTPDGPHQADHCSDWCKCFYSPYDLPGTEAQKKSCKSEVGIPCGSPLQKNLLTAQAVNDLTNYCFRNMMLALLLPDSSATCSR